MRSSPSVASNAVESTKSLNTTIATPPMRDIFAHGWRNANHYDSLDEHEPIPVNDLVGRVRQQLTHLRALQPSNPRKLL